MIDKLLGSPEITVLDAMRLIEETAEKLLIIIDTNRRLLGTLTDGDVRRYILKGADLHNPIEKIYNRQSTFLSSGYSKSKAKKLMLEKNIQVIPVIDENKRVVDILFWHNLFETDEAKAVVLSKTPVVIMAGGKGTRLDPITRIIPKPLIPMGNKTITELIIENFANQGAIDFYMTVNYKAELIKSYFDSISYSYNLNLVDEPDFLGTAGSLQYLPQWQADNFIVSNCDIMVEADYGEVLEFHIENNYAITMLGSIQSYAIPYGVINFSENGQVEKIEEKPEYNLTVNTGVYIFNKRALKYLPKDTFFNVTDLIDELMKKKEKVGVFPIGAGAYTDIGQWDEYHKNIDKLKKEK